MDDYRKDPFMKALLAKLKKEMEENQNRKYVINEARMDGLLDKCSKIKSLLASEDCEYKLNIKRQELYPDAVSINIKTQSFGANALNMKSFREILEDAESFGIEGLLNEVCEISISYRDIYKTTY